MDNVTVFASQHCGGIAHHEWMDNVAVVASQRRGGRGGIAHPPPRVTALPARDLVTSGNGDSRCASKALLLIHISFAIMEPFSGRLRYPSNNSYEFSEGRMEAGRKRAAISQSIRGGILSISTHSITLCNFEGGGEIHSLAVAETRPA